MTLERLLSWTTGLLVVAVVVALARTGPPRATPEVVVGLLLVLGALPLAVVFLGWLYTFRSRSAGRVGARLRSLR